MKGDKKLKPSSLKCYPISLCFLCSPLKKARPVMQILFISEAIHQKFYIIFLLNRGNLKKLESRAGQLFPLYAKETLVKLIELLKSGKFFKNRNLGIISPPALHNGNQWLN